MDTTHTNDVEMADTSFILWCLTEGQINHFSLTATDVSIKVDDLKTMIKGKAEVDHPAHTLNLWKVRRF